MKQNKECVEYDEFKKEINLFFDELEKDALEFYNKENAAAGVRLRKGYKKMNNYIHGVLKMTLNKNK